MKNEAIFVSYLEQLEPYFLRFTIKTMNTYNSSGRIFSSADEEPYSIIEDALEILITDFNAKGFAHKPINEFKNYSLKTITNKIYTYFDKEMQQQRIGDKLQEQFTDFIVNDVDNVTNNSPDASYENMEHFSETISALREHLTTSEWELLVLARVEKLPRKEIADILGIPINTVKTRVARLFKKVEKVKKHINGGGVTLTLLSIITFSIWF